MLVFENSLLRSVPTLSSAQRGDRFMSVCLGATFLMQLRLPSEVSNVVPTRDMNEGKQYQHTKMAMDHGEYGQIDSRNDKQRYPPQSR